MKPLQYYKKQIFIMGCLGMFPMLVFAQETLSSANGLHGDYSGSRVERSADGDKLDIEFSIGLVEKLKSQQMMYISPRFVSVDGKKSVELEPVCISGRRRYKVVKRRKTLHNVKSDQLGYGEVHSVKELKETPLTFKSSFPFESWMADGHLVVDEKLYGCAECGMSKNDGIALQAGIPLFGAKDYAYDFIEPEKVLVKCYKDSFDCKVTFPVAQHDLRKTFADNRQELAGLGQFVSENLLIKGAELKDVYIKGYASPESPYSHNRDLAIGRTAALKNHIKQLYHFNDSVIVTEYEPEDWKGLRQYVEKSNLVHRSEILGMIDSRLDPDAKEAKIKRTYPEEYRFLLQNCYPALRHTDYRIDYTIRSFSDVEEIKRIMQTQPQKLSLNEFYLVAQTYEPGSVEFNDVFETAVRMYPNDEIANLNAANSAMQRKDVENAKRYLQKGGDSPEALYARGVYAFLVEDYTVARKQLNEAKNKGVQQAEIILLEIDKIDK